MRIIAGAYRSRALHAPAGMDTRPTSDRLRETLFNVLTNGATDRILGSFFLDLYAGSGAVGIEALSRGASHVTFVEQAAPAVTALQKNLDGLGIHGKSPNLLISKQSVSRFLRSAIEKAEARRFSTVFLDPPYEDALEYATTLNTLASHSAELLTPGALIVAEHRRKTALAEAYGTLKRTRVLEQGDAALSFFIDDEVTQA